MFSHCEVVKQNIMLRTEAQTASDQSHVLTDVVTIYVGPTAAGRKQTCNVKETEQIPVR